MIKKFMLFLVFLVVPIYGAYPACEATTKVYTACKAGYYLNGVTCYPCVGGGTSKDKNSSGLSACYLPAGTVDSDISGTFTYTEDCYYSY